jgi:hypothetical protein
MSRPEEIVIHIEPDGRIVLDGREMQETSYKRILDLIRETVGPAHAVEVDGGEPPTRHLKRSPRGRRETEQDGPERRRIERKG